MLVAVLAAGPALAQCLPDPTVTHGTTACTGTNGLTVATANTRIVVAGGVIVQPGGAVAAITSRASSTSFQINGGTGKPGLFVTTGAPTTVPGDPYAGASVGYCFLGSTQTSYPSASTTVAVAAGGTVTGAQGILIRRDASNTNGYISASINNAGTISGRGRSMAAPAPTRSWCRAAAPRHRSRSPRLPTSRRSA